MSVLSSKDDGKCNMPSPAGSSCPYCMGASVFEMREVVVTIDKSTVPCIFRYCLNHLRSRVAVGLVDGSIG